MKQYSNAAAQAAPYKTQNDVQNKIISLSEASRDLVMNHLISFQNNFLDAVMADYTNESILVTQDATYRGPREIKAFFTALMMHFPKHESSFILDKLVVHDELAYIVWHAITPSLEIPLGTDTFILKDGKILQQTFAGELRFIS